MIASKAALTPLGGVGEDMAGYKGYNYATFVEIMSAALSSANFCTHCLGIKMVDGKQVYEPYKLGHFFIAVDVEAFGDLPTFKKTVGDILRQCAESRKAPGADHIYVAGEKEYKTETQRAKEGVPLSEETQLQLQQMLQELKLDDKKYGIHWAVKYTGKADAQGW
jgi:LDH2 family malate/lactate/ureidoglycolate dehydrogenase